MDVEMRLVLGGDVMTGRGVDQILASPVPAELHEDFVRDARTYVKLAERVNGPVPHPVGPEWPWGAALDAMDAFGHAVRVLNLETSVTRSEEFAAGKAVTYRMSPANLAVLAVARADVWALANNHVLDYGVSGLRETLTVMREGGLRTAGAGLDIRQAWEPAVVRRDSDHRVLVMSVADVSSGVPPDWAAMADRPGVALLPGLTEAGAEAVVHGLRQDSTAGDLLVVSVHWGSNWGYGIPREQRRFAHRLVDAGVDVVHGHSSHHPRPIEVYRDRLVLYGSGDLVNDYEGIQGYESFRDDLRLLYLAQVEAGTGRLTSLHMVPLHARRLSLERATGADADWLARTLDDEGRRLGTRVEVSSEGLLRLRW